jgi:GNAT superfamily N-acetyltransferase
MVTTRRRAHPVRIRPIRLTDLGRLERFYAGLSPDSLNARFHGASRGIAERAARSFCGPDHAHREGFVALVDGDDDGETIVGHLCLEPTEHGELELAVAVADARQRHGIGRALLESALDWAAAHGVDRVRARIRWSNPAITGLLRTVGRPLTLAASDDGDLEAVIEVGGGVPLAA